MRYSFAAVIGVLGLAAVAPAHAAQLQGQVVEPATGAPVGGATVSVAGSDAEAITDAQGQYQIEVEPGTYTLEITAGGDYEQKTVEGVEVTADGAVTRQIELARGGGEDVAEYGEYTIQRGYVEGSPASVVTTQREAPQVSDVIGNEQMRAAGDGDAAEALKRVTGLAVEDGKFITIRGQPERYTKTTLNGSPLPSPDPIRRIVPLDLFPTNILSEVSVSKSYDASQPGSFGSGLVDLRTQGAPEETFFEISVSTGGNTESTGEDGLDYEGGDVDVLGFDDDTREASGGLNSTLDGNASDQQTIEQGARSQPNIWETESETLPPDYGLGVSGGTNGTLFGAELGLQGSLTWSQEYRQRDTTRRTFAVTGTGELRQDSEVLERRTDRDIEIGGFFTASLDWGSHKLTSNTFVTRQTTQRTEITTGEDTSSQGVDFFDTLLDWNERQLLGEQVIGEHDFALLDVEWRALFAEAERDNPDRRFFRRTRQLGSDDPFRLSDREDATRRFVDTEDEVSSFALDLERSLIDREALTLDVSGGFSTYTQDRDSSTRRLGLRPDSSQDLTAPTEEILAPENLGDEVEVKDTSLTNDFFTGEADVDAVYVEGDVGWANTLRVVGGVRQESAEFTSVAGINSTDPTVGGFDETDTLPSLSTTWFFAEDMQARLAAGSTVSRPTLNEIADEAQFRDPDTDDLIQGNGDLQPTEIDSLDLRWEWFPSSSELISVGVFTKDYTDPIEREIIAIGGESETLRVVNAGDAEVEGLEATARVNLPRITEPLGADWDYADSMYLQGNVAFIDSEVTLDDPGLATNKERRLQGQADELFNLLVGYDGSAHDAAVALNYTGDRLDAAGRNGQPDIVEESRFLVNVTYDYAWSDSLSFNAEVENLLDEEVELTQGGKIREEYDPGVDFTVGLDYRF